MSTSRIANAGNTVVPAYLCLKEKGYKVREEKKSDAGETHWIASKEGIELLADDPVELLGLATIYETRGKEWKASDEQIEAFLKKIRPNQA